jgi:hypothetical protein
MKEFVELFTGLERAHGCTYVDKKDTDGLKIKGKSFVKREPVTEQLWQNHLNGIEPSLGIIPINEDNKCRWGCIDVDKYTLDHSAIIKKINSFKLPLTVCRSKSGGAHIFLYTSDDVPAKLMRDKLMSISAILGFGNAEVFPKQVQLKSQDDTGNFLNLPYFNCKNSTRYAYDNSGNAITIDSFLSNVKRITPEELQSLKIERPYSEFSDGPPCLESLTREKLNDGRDRILFQYRVYAKKKWPEEWRNKLNYFNHKYFNPPYPDDTIEKFKKDNKEYGYKCHEDPMCDHCDKKLCGTRKFGVGRQKIFPQLSGLQKINLEEPYYFINVDGDRIKLDNVDYLLQQRLFKRAIAKQINKRVPDLTKKEFGEFMDPLMETMEIIEPPAGSSKIEQLTDNLEEWCTDRTAEGSVKEDMIFGNVWNFENHHHFIYTHFFHKFLLRRKWPAKQEETLTWLVLHCNCEQVRMSIGKKKLSVMRVKQFKKQNVKTQPIQYKKEDAF